MTDNMKKPWMILIPLLLTGCGHKDTIDPGTWTSYRNPVWQTDVQDPSVLLDDGHFYLFSSETSEVLLPMATSDNLTFWEPTGSAVDDANRPDFIDGGTVQSPEIAAVGGKYILYYSLYKSDAASGIGVAVADIPTGPFKDRGALLTALDTGLLNVLDPAFLADDGANYLVFGRSKGIYLQKLSADGLSADGLPVGNTSCSCPWARTRRAPTAPASRSWAAPTGRKGLTSTRRGTTCSSAAAAKPLSGPAPSSGPRGMGRSFPCPTGPTG